MDSRHSQNGAQRIDHSRASASNVTYNQNPTREELQHTVDLLRMENDRLRRQCHELDEEKHAVLVEARTLADENHVLKVKVEKKSSIIHHLYQKTEELELVNDVLRQQLNEKD